MLLLLLSLFATCPLETDNQQDERLFQRVPGTPLVAESLTSDSAVRRALERGIAFLAARQSTSVDGSLPTGDARNSAPLGITAISALAYMALGNTPGRGPQGDELERAVHYLLDHTDLAPASPEFGFISTSGDEVSRTHGHGFATLALAQAFGMSPRSSKRIARALLAAVRRIEISQGPEGGWEYAPLLTANHEGSVTICYVQALRAARNVGITVDNAVIRRAEDYVLRLQKADGTFRYKLDMEDSTVALTAASISTLNMAGRYDDSVIQSAIDAIWSALTIRAEKARANRPGGRSKWPYYQRLYIAEAFWQLSDTSHFDQWFADERDRILRTQEPDGSWPSAEYGNCYATAVNCLVLAIPEGVLPILQR